MSSSSRSRDARVGLVVLAGVLGVIALVVTAAGGPGYLASNRTTIDVLFRDGQGIRVGQPVRIAGLDAGRVADVDVVEYEGGLRARVRISVGREIAGRLKQDAVIAIESDLTGQSSVNIASVGESGVSWVPGQAIEGVESSLFDPLLEEIGLGPVERGHLSHTVAEVRRVVDELAPRLTKTAATFQEISSEIQAASETAGPAIARAAEDLETLGPKIDDLLADLDVTIEENRENLRATVANARAVSNDAKELIASESPRIAELIGKLEQTRRRLDQVLYRADAIGKNAETLVARSAPEIEQTVLNIRDATEYARRTAQRISANPILLSPLYKPSPEAEVAFANYDTAQEIGMASRELHESIRRIEAVMQNPQAHPQQRQRLDEMLQRASQLEAELRPIARRLSEGSRQVEGDGGRGLFGNR